jgi:hypothetical protein
MHWYNNLAIFIGGAFLANCLPHLMNGISGRPFQSPFASPPGKGLSSPTVNVLWGLFNLLLAYLLAIDLGKFALQNSLQAVLLGAGFLLISLLAARQFGQFHGGR